MFKAMYETLFYGKLSMSLSMTISSPEVGILTVSVLPKGEGLNLKPLVLTGTPEELDAGFVAEIERAGKSVAGLVSNIESFNHLVATEKEAQAGKSAAAASSPATPATTVKKVTPKAPAKMKGPAQASIFDIPATTPPAPAPAPKPACESENEDEDDTCDADDADTSDNDELDLDGI